MGRCGKPWKNVKIVEKVNEVRKLRRKLWVKCGKMWENFEAKGRKNEEKRKCMSKYELVTGG